MTEKNENVSLGIENSSQKSGDDAIDVTEKEMLERIIEKQNEQDKINKELIENQQKLMVQLQSIQDNQNGKKRKQVDNNDSIKIPVKRADLDTSTVDQVRSRIEKTGKCFSVEHTFKNVSKLENNVYFRSEQQEHFGVFWMMYIYRNKKHLAFYAVCRNTAAQGIWSIEVDCETKLLSKNRKPDIRKCCAIIKRDEIGAIRNPLNWGLDEYLKWDELEPNFLIDDSLTFKVTFKINNMTGIYKDNLRSFDDPECSDVVLIVQGKKFHVLKLYLATHSSYFKAMFLGMFSDSNKSDIPLTGIDADDFQNYLEVLYGDDAIDEYTVEGVLLVADMYHTPVVIKKCQQFLLKESKKTLKKMLEMSVRYNLEELKNKCLSEIKTSNDIRAVLPVNIRDLDHSLLADLLEKSLASD